MQKPSAKRESVIEMLEHGGLTEQNVRDISQQTDVPEADIWGAGSFYHLIDNEQDLAAGCLLYTSPSPRDLSTSRMPSSA